MYLCDIGNTNATIKKNEEIFSISIDEFLDFNPKEKVFFINVNFSLKDSLKKKDNFVNLKSYFNFSTNYQGMGIDRVAACYTVKDGLIVDAGSAITVDVMENGFHKGGFIMPGIKALKFTCKKISPILDVNMDAKVDLSHIPQNTSNAVNYGVLKPIILAIKNLHVKNKNIYITGGDGEFLSNLIQDSVYKKDLLFDGMKKVIDENRLISKEEMC